MSASTLGVAVAKRTGERRLLTETERHNLIVANLIIALGAQLRGGPCRVYPSDMRVRNPVTNSYMFPDVVVVCGESRFADEERDVLLNPTLLIEVLSDSTERKDRGEKSEAFRRLESLQEYLLVSQFGHRAECYRRYGERQWMLTETLALEEQIELDSIGCALALRDIYENVLPSDAGEGASTEPDYG